MGKYWTSTKVYVLLLLVTSACKGEDSCYSSNTNPYLYFGTKTTYDVVRNPFGIPKVPECTPMQVWMVARHGANIVDPEEKSQYVNLLDLRDEILQNHEQGRGSLCPEDLTQLREWREMLVSSQERDSLSPKGVRDTYSLGLRVRQTFPDLFTNSDPRRDFIFRHSAESRSKQTVEYFIRGLFGFIYNPSFSNTQYSSELENHDYCPAWIQKNNKMKGKLEAFTSGKSMKEVYKNVSQRLGFNYELPLYVVDAIYKLCASERSYTLDSTAPWCSAFSTADLKALEFLDDMHYYYKTGPGDRSTMNKRLGCPLVRDMIQRFREIETSPDAERARGVFYFGEAEVVGLLATRLGLFADRHAPSSGSYVREGQSHRTYRTSGLLPYGANIMAVFYQCSSGEKYRVMFLVSEYVVQLPGCASGLCPWSLVHHRLGRSLERHGCSLEFCSKFIHFWVPMPSEELWAIVIIGATVLFIIYMFKVTNYLTA